MQHTLGGSRLTRLLQEWAQVEGDAARQDVAQQLSHWVGAFDAVKLDASLQSIETYAARTKLKGQMLDCTAMHERVQALKAQLLAEITQRCTPVVLTLPRAKGDTRPPEDPDALDEAKYAPHYQRYQNLQKLMDVQIGSLRDEMRQIMAKGVPTLRQLVALDSVMAQMLGPKEQKLWASVPVYLERRMNHWRQMHQDRLQANGQADAPHTWRQPGGWIARFQQDMKEMLAAELHMRMQPLLGLLEAAQNVNPPPAP